MLGAFKAHASLILWRMGESGGATSREREGMGHFGKITSLADLPADAEVIAAVQARRWARSRRASRRRPKAAPRPELPVPDELAAALAAAPGAKATLDGFAPSQRREYYEWIGEAKRPETRARARRAGGGMAVRGQDRGTGNIRGRAGSEGAGVPFLRHPGESWITLVSHREAGRIGRGPSQSWVDGARLGPSSHDSEKVRAASCLSSRTRRA